MYCEWCGVCGLVLSVVEVCANYGGVNVFVLILPSSDIQCHWSGPRCPMFHPWLPCGHIQT